MLAHLTEVIISVVLLCMRWKEAGLFVYAPGHVEETYI